MDLEGFRVHTQEDSERIAERVAEILALAEEHYDFAIKGLSYLPLVYAGASAIAAVLFNRLSARYDRPSAQQAS